MPRADSLQRILVSGAVALALTAVAHAENMPQGRSGAETSSKLKELEGELKKSQAERDKAAAHAADVAREAESMRNDMVGTAEAIQENEEALSDLELQLKSLDTEEQAKAAALDLRRQQMNGVITALARLAFRPTEALIGQPTSPADTVRSAILLREEVPRLRQAAESLKADLDAVTKVRLAIATQKQRITGASEKLDADHRHLTALYAKKAEARDQAEAQSHETEARLTALATQAQDVRDLLARIDSDKASRAKEQTLALNAPPPELKAPEPKPVAPQPAEPKLGDAKPGTPEPPVGPPAASGAGANPQAGSATKSQPAAIVRPVAPRSFAQAQGRMPFPARGHVTIHFGQGGEGGLPARGITIETRPGAQVVAPYDGEVAFAGPFRGYGLLLIIEHSEGYHTLLAGMARIDSAVGQRLVAGEPVGVMEISEDKPLLYVELRHQGQPINPLPWLMAHKSKVSE